MKRLIDASAALTAIIIFAPVILVLMVLIRFKLGSPIFFRQMRPGWGCVPFYMIKFRTMSNQRDTGGALLSDDERLTRFGTWLRSTSLDELPELFNVLKGDMSLVGPRPLLMEYLPLYTSRQARRHEVRPGLTGWAQVNGRNALSWEEKFELDVWYIDNRSFWVDVKILFKTVLQVVKREGISHSGEATMPRFTGSDQER